MQKKKAFTPKELEIVELPQREAMLKIRLNNIRLFNKLF